MHDHSTDGGREAFEAEAHAYQLRLHLDNAHDVRTNGGGHDHLAALHRSAHLVTERLAEAPPAVVRSITGDRSMYLEDANGTLYLAEPVDSRHVPTVGPLYRLTEQAKLPADLLAATKASLAATSAWLAAHPSEGPTPSAAPGEESGSAGRQPSPGAPSGLNCGGVS